MKYVKLFKTATGGLTTNKSRSLLTVLGIVIGITSIIIVMSIGRGAENLILGQIEGFGITTISIDPGKRPDGPSGFAELYTDSLRQKDVDALERPENVEGVQDVIPVVMQPAAMTFQGETVRPTIFGATEAVFDVLDVDLDAGQFFTKEDVGQKARVVVLGSETKEDLFGDSDAVGENVKIGNTSFRVIGVLEDNGATLMSTNEMALSPYPAVQQYITGTSHFNSLMVRVESKEVVDRAARDIEATLRETHDIDDPEDDDFNVSTSADAAEMVGTITSVLTALLGSVAGISLVVGGIGIMNIMLVSVTERTREIGLRKALGATNREIMRQFLLEAVLLTALGGVIGIVLGALFSYVAAFVLRQTVVADWAFAFPISAALLGLGVSAFVGLVFGLYPARQAAKKSPIEALRYE